LALPETPVVPLTDARQTEEFKKTNQSPVLL
jgi:hypothetical protein